jgi:hypothetical protein
VQQSGCSKDNGDCLSLLGSGCRNDVGINILTRESITLDKIIVSRVMLNKCNGQDHWIKSTARP